MPDSDNVVGYNPAAAYDTRYDMEDVHRRGNANLDDHQMLFHATTAGFQGQGFLALSETTSTNHAGVSNGTTNVTRFIEGGHQIEIELDAGDRRASQVITG